MMMAKDGEVAFLFQALIGVEPQIFLGTHEGKVADPMIEAVHGFDHRIGHFQPLDMADRIPKPLVL